MYLWRRRATPKWWARHDFALRELFGGNIAIIERPNHKTIEIEITCDSPEKLKSFGGRARKLPRDWLNRFARQQKTKPIRIGNHQLRIPAGAAFGTGEHAATSMCLTLLKRHFRAQELDWLKQSSCNSRLEQRRRRVCSVVDLGTGSGILALAACLLGATRVVAIDNDPIAVRTARQNARVNRVRGVQFIVGDARKLRGRVDLVCANLYSELLVEALPNWRGTATLILSGILRGQERDVTRAVRANDFAVVEVRRRGKWIAMLAATGR